MPTQDRLAVRLITFTAALLLLAGAAAEAQPAPPGPTATRGMRGMAPGARPRVIIVTGHGEVEAMPDVAELRLGVTERSPELQQARERVGAAVERFLELCDSLGIEREAVSTTGLNIRPRYRYDRDDGEQTLTGYEVTRQLQITLRDVDRVGGLLEGAVALGVNQVTPPRLDVSDRRALRRQALAEAAQDARAQAQVLAQTLDAEVGEVRRIDAGETAVRPPPVLARAERMSLADGAEETYTAGMVNVSADVTVVFELLARGRPPSPPGPGVP